MTFLMVLDIEVSFTVMIPRLCQHESLTRQDPKSKEMLNRSTIDRCDQ